MAPLPIIMRSSMNILMLGGDPNWTLVDKIKNQTPSPLIKTNRLVWVWGMNILSKWWCNTLYFSNPPYHSKRES